MQKTKTPKSLTEEAGRPIVILDRHETRNDAKKIAKEHNAELPSLKEFIVWLKDRKNFDQAKDGWFWLREPPGLTYDGFCKIDYEKGTLEKIKESEWERLPKEQQAYSYREVGDLRLCVGDIDNRLGLYAADAEGYTGRVAFVKLEEPKRNLKERAKKHM